MLKLHACAFAGNAWQIKLITDSLPTRTCARVKTQVDEKCYAISHVFVFGFLSHPCGERRMNYCQWGLKWHSRSASQHGYWDWGEQVYIGSDQIRLISLRLCFVRNVSQFYFNLHFMNSNSGYGIESELQNIFQLYCYLILNSVNSNKIKSKYTFEPSFLRAVVLKWY